MADLSYARALSNRGECYARMRCWPAALADADAALALQPGHAKSGYRRALALLMLQRPREALEAVAGLPASSEVDALLLNIKRAVGEKEEGVYDFNALRAEAKAGARAPATMGPISRLHADYEHADIEVVPLGGGKGRGIVARSPLAAGTLVMASKAFVGEFVDPKRSTVNGQQHDGKYKRHPPSTYKLKP